MRKYIKKAGEKIFYCGFPESSKVIKIEEFEDKETVISWLDKDDNYTI